VANIALRIRQSLNLEEIMEMTVREVRTFLESDRVLVYQFAPDFSGTIVAESVGTGWTTSLGKQIIDTCFQQGSAVKQYCQGQKRAIANIYQAGLTPCHIELLEQFQVKANLVVPILLPNNTPESSQLWGLLISHHCANYRQWEAAELDLLEQLAVQIAISIQQAQLFERLSRELTKRKKAQRLLQQTNEELEQRVQQRTASLQQEIQERLQVEAALRDSEERLRLFIEHAPSAIAMFDQQMCYLAASRRWRDDYNLGDREIIGRSHYEIFPDIPQRWKDIHQHCLTGFVKKCEEDPFPRASGETEWVRWAIHPWYMGTGDVGGIVMFTEVITERKQAQQQLQQANQELVRSNQELEQFAYVASHDLREPLRKVKSFTELLAEDYQGQLDESASKYMNYITDGVTRMENLIASLLSYSRVGRNELKLVPVDLNAVSEQVLADLSLAIEENGACITVEPLPTVLADSQQMTQLLQNLMANALKFRREIEPQIRIWATPQGKQWQIAVADNGIGIKPQYSERIFEIFQRLHSRAKYSGTGIGLAICKKIVERHGGQIYVDSKVGVGSTFCFTLTSA
jgi:PAS domain S-box-containing protein